MASNQSTEGDSKPDDQQIFETKLIDYNGFQLRIVAQDKNGPCPLIAVCNVLLLRQKFHLVSLTVSADTLLEHVADQLCQGAASVARDQNQDLSQALEALPRFRTGIDVNFRFNKIDGFIDMPELAVFRLLKIPLYHGWMVDPQDSDTAEAFGSKPYNRIIKEVADFRARYAGGEEKNVLLEDGGFHQKGKGDLEEQKALHKALALSSVSESAELDESGCSLHLDKAGHLSACDITAILGPSATNGVNSSMDVRGPVDEREVVVAKQVERVCENDSDIDLSPFIIRARGLLIDTFLENNKNQLTIYGLCALQEGLADGELCVFFCSNHFNTMTKCKNELYVLVTDQGYVSQTDLVWGKLNEVNGDTVFFTGDFKIFRQEAWIKDSWDEQKALTATNNYLASSKSSALSNDEQLATEFQRKKYKSKLQRRPTSKPASRVTTGLQVEPGHPEDLFDGADDYWNDSGF
ncbi:hypothetical protein C5167_035801 [Papaver somniferum]|uniref:ubiquitin carboxyl-terminal hydrolase MINDY-1-like n=1 Tax=Papaver somniferum TaxID=3469 RepID=UPI000E6FA42E|nr:ubiquitin carboxyl-terminal hydrolase MINDY-1-like [Papaver somniferum]RZC89806.1 hypothetical protein C5167_035801 [Papaver somniferum]